jgi:hypothetical protein
VTTPEEPPEQGTEGGEEERPARPTFGEALRAGARSSPAAARASKRSAKIRAQVEKNRRGEYKIPTWGLIVILVVVLVGWALLIALG